MRSALLIIAVAIGLLLFTFGFTYVTGGLWNQNFLYIGGFQVFLTVLTDQINLNALNMQGRGVIIPYLISIVLKLILSIIFLVVLIKQNSEAVPELVIVFLVYYAIFSALEIFLVSRRTKK
ncbi:MAG: hypothetical protein DRI71_05680 [Bacteroidetes bacterium]|nr:MAG: hypothetical protein DRI71_05680 [Bacteroidota bacterium]